jgi:hypothetical protein
MKILILLFLAFTQAGCSMLLGSRKFIDEMENSGDFFEAGEDFRVTVGDEAPNGRTMEQIYARTPSSSPDKRRYVQTQKLSEELQYLESRQTQLMARHYEMYRHELSNISEKIYFLRLGTLGERENYLRSRGIVADHYSSDKALISRAIQTRDIIVGMTKQDVISSWGRPSRVDVAGNPRYENERWSFYERGNLKQVFFENGRVQGWVVE